MSGKTKIAWCDSTWNPWIGCTKVSEGCKNCYAENSTPTRVARSKGLELWGGTNRQRASKATFEAPLKWDKTSWVCDECGTAQSFGDQKIPKLGDGCERCLKLATFHRRRVFSLSLGDWLDNAVPIEWLADMLDVIRRCPNLDFLLLTKRPENFSGRIRDVLNYWSDCDAKSQSWVHENAWHWLKDWVNGKAPANVWIGCTVENQEQADKRIPELLKIPAAKLFISYEPGLGPVDFTKWINCYRPDVAKRKGELRYIRSVGKEWLDWIIVGGESGPNARPFNIEWARNTIAQCKAAGVACFVKQLGSKPHQPAPGMEEGPYMLMRDKKGGDMAEWPSDLRVRETPGKGSRWP